MEISDPDLKHNRTTLSHIDVNGSEISFKDDPGHQTAPEAKKPDLSIQTIFDAESLG